MAEYWVTKDVQEFYLINATDQQHAENIASKHLHTLYKIVDSEVKDIRVEKKSTTVQVDFINRENREDMTLKELMQDIKDSCELADLEDYLDVELYFFKLPEDDNLRDDEYNDTPLKFVELICTSGSTYVDIGLEEQKGKQWKKINGKDFYTINQIVKKQIVKKVQANKLYK